MSESSYTELQKNEIHELSERIKEIHRPRLSRIEPITNDMVHLLHHDDELKSVYNKKTVILGSLKFLKETHTEEQKIIRMKQIREKEIYIDIKLHEEEELKKKKPSRCSKSLSISCTIL